MREKLDSEVITVCKHYNFLVHNERVFNQKIYKVIFYFSFNLDPQKHQNWPKICTYLYGMKSFYIPLSISFQF